MTTKTRPTTTTLRSDRARAFLASAAERVEAALDRHLPPESAWPEELHRACRYAVFGRGKRLRPALSLAAAEACGASTALLDEILVAACGIALVHTYSLVHDDLPALDDDDLRRGRPTTHVAFGEAMAILVGDSLLTLGLDWVGTRPAGDVHALRRTRAFTEVVRAIGTEGMIGGQVEDLAATGDAGTDDAARSRRLTRIHHAKTARLITASLLHGAFLADADDARVALFRRYGDALGQAFQIADDILDETGTAATLGKSAGKDRAQGKLTYPALYGLDAARERLAGERTEALEAAREIEGDDGLLASLAVLVSDRES